MKQSTPVQIEALGTVTPIASVAIKSRIDSEITGIHFADGARVKQGDLLITLDSRTIEAQILQAEGNIARDKAQLEGAERDIRRYTELVRRTRRRSPISTMPRRRPPCMRAALKANEAMLKNLQVQLSYATIRAPISGRISAASVKVGNFVRSADMVPIATIIQTAPVYVSFPMPQVSLPALREAIAEGEPIGRGRDSGRDQARGRPHRDDREHRSMPRPAWSMSAPRCRTRTSCCGRARWCRPI